MPVDVATEITIDRPIEEVSAFVADPSNAPEWYRRISVAEALTAPPLAVGSRTRFVASFLGRTLDYVYEVVDFVPGERLVMRTAEGPFAMETSYAWTPAAGGGTRMVLRNRGEPTGFSRFTAPMMTRAMRSANRKDLGALKALLEGSSGTT